MKRESNDVKQLVAQVATYVAQQIKVTLPMPVLQAWIPMLVNGTKEKNTVVRSQAEQALLAVLRLRQGNAVLEVSRSQVKALAVLLHRLQLYYAINKFECHTV